MTADELRAWRAAGGWSQATAARLLGLSLRGYRNYEGGQRHIPVVVELACAAIDHGWRLSELRREAGRKDRR